MTGTPQPAAAVARAPAPAGGRGQAAPAPRVALDRDSALALQGMAILMMLTHHLFGLPGLVHPPAAWWPTVPGLPVEAEIGRLAKACVGVFLFLSGFGLMRAAALAPRTALSRALRFWGQVLPYALLAWVVGVLFFPGLGGGQAGGPRFPTDPLTALANLLTLRNDFAYEWWFAEVYLALVLLSPLLLRLARHPLPALGLSAAGFVLGALLDQSGLRFPLMSWPNLLIWQLPFLQGAVIAGLPATALPARSGPARSVTRHALPLSLVVLIAACGLVEVLRPAALTPVLIVTAPLWVLVLHAVLVRLPGAARRGLAALGRFSLPVWLVHPLLLYAFAQPLVYAPRWAPLVLLWLLALSLSIALPVEALRRALVRHLVRRAA